MTPLNPYRQVIGYHGTTTSKLAEYREHGFVVGANTGDWLGGGLYFWEADPIRAYRWAAGEQQRYGGDRVVLRAHLDLTRSLDLTTTRHRRLFKAAYDFLAAQQQDVLTTAHQDDYVREIDARVIESILHYTRKPGDDGRYFDSVRACFSDGDSVYVHDGKKSGVHDLDHVQIAVTQSSAITRIHPVQIHTGN